MALCPVREILLSLSSTEILFSVILIAKVIMIADSLKCLMFSFYLIATIYLVIMILACNSNSSIYIYIYI